MVNLILNYINIYTVIKKCTYDQPCLYVSKEIQVHARINAKIRVKHLILYTRRGRGREKKRFKGALNPKE